MKVRELLTLLGRYDLNTEIDGHTLAVLRIKHSGHLVLIPAKEKADLLARAPYYYEDPVM